MRPRRTQGLSRKIKNGPSREVFNVRDFCGAALFQGAALSRALPFAAAREGHWPSKACHLKRAVGDGDRYGTFLRSSSSQTVGSESLGARQSPRGEREPPLPT